MKNASTTCARLGQITWIPGEQIEIRYISGESVYTENFDAGRLLVRDWRDNAVPAIRDDTLRWRGVPAFDLTVDGQSLTFGWMLIDHAETALPDGTVEATLMLRNSLKPLMLTIRTRCGGDGFFGRALYLRNEGETPQGITSVQSLRGEVYRMGSRFNDSLSGPLLDDSIKPYSLGYFRSDSWGSEGDFQWEDIPYNVNMGIGSDRGRSGHGHPLMIVRNNLRGGYFLAQLEWSANWEAGARCVMLRNDMLDHAVLAYAIGPTSPSPARMLAPGEEIELPRVHFGTNHTDFDALIQSLHRYQRRCVLEPRNNCQSLFFNSSDYVADAITEQTLIDTIDLYHSVGGELLIVDAGWFGKGLGKDTWFELTGDWDANPDRFPNDLNPAFDYARSLGIKVGMWAEVESAGKDSRLAREHPDWFLTRYGESVPRALNLSLPDVRKYIEESIVRLIDRYELDLFRLDHNTYLLEGGYNALENSAENTLYRHVEAIWAIIASLRKRYPHMEFENCASGGGRTDLGMLRHFTTTWVSDWFKMPRTVRILNGMTLALPPEYVNRVFGVCLEGCYVGNFETQLQVATMAHMTLIGIAPHLTQANPAALETVRKYVGIYKDFIRPMHAYMRVYHHTPVLEGHDGAGWCALEYAHEDYSRAAACVFRQHRAEGSAYRFKFRGLDIGELYSVQILPGNQRAIWSGAYLTHEGLDLRLDTPLTSRMLLATRIAD